MGKTGTCDLPIIERRKLVVVGDGDSGKTCLLMARTKDVFQENYTATVIENSTTEVQVDDQPVNLVLWDTSDQEYYNKLRPLAYPDTDVFLVCFAIDHPTSLKNVVDWWAGELKVSCPGVPFVLVGNKKDLRDDPASLQPVNVSREEAEVVAGLLGAEAYTECSAKTREGVREVFQIAARIALRRKLRSRRHRTCTLL